MTEGRILLVTGASSEVGIQLIREIAGQYVKIWCHYGSAQNEIDKLKEIYGEKIIPIQADFSDEESLNEMIEVIKKSGELPNNIVHLACNRAYNLQFHKCNWGNFEESININLRSITVILEALIKPMMEEGYGRIVFMLTSYILGAVAPKYQGPYITAKYALYGLMRSLASEYAEKGITVNAVSPDMMETKFVSEIPKHIVKMTAENNPIGRNIRVSDVIPAIRYFLSDEAEAVTGQNIGVTGGVR